MPVREVVIYSRRGCLLCVEMLVEAEPLCRGAAMLVVRDVDTREDWVQQYGNDVPVLTVDNIEVCRHRLDREALVVALQA